MAEPKGWNWNNVPDVGWSTPAEDVYYLLHRWQERGFLSILDLGCGIGRHSLFFAGHGYQVIAADVSDSGLGRLTASARDKGVLIAVLAADAAHLPFEAESFDAILAYHSIYHTDSAGMKKAIDEVHRVLRFGGEIFLSLNSKTSRHYTDPALTSIDANTRLKRDRDGTLLPHFFADHDCIRSLLTDFKILRTRHVQDIWNGRTSWHYFVLAAKQEYF